jgi:hypothetical protein
MPLPLEHIKEYLSTAYVRAVVAMAGCSFTPLSQDYGIDAYVNEVQLFPDGRFITQNWKFGCQIKSTTSAYVENGNLIYDMRAEAYNRLLEIEGPTPVILVLFYMPTNEASWLMLDENQMLLRRCCYWTLLSGPPTANTATQRIRIPRTQLFEPTAVTNLLAQIKCGQL